MCRTNSLPQPLDDPPVVYEEDVLLAFYRQIADSSLCVEMPKDTRIAVLSRPNFGPGTRFITDLRCFMALHVAL